MADTAMLLWGNFCTALAYFILTVQMIWFIRNPKVCLSILIVFYKAYLIFNHFKILYL